MRAMPNHADWEPCRASIEQSFTMLDHLGGYLGLSWNQAWPSGGHLEQTGPILALWVASWSKKFKTIALAHKNKGAPPWVLWHILGSPLQQKV